MRLVPKKPFTFILIGFVLYAYISYPSGKSSSDLKNHADSGFEAAKKSGLQIFTHPVNAIADKLQNTDEGRAVVTALQEQALKKKYSDREVPLIMAGSDKAITSIDYIMGQGGRVTCGSEVTINYDSFAEKNVKIDSTKYRNEPITFKVGDGKVVKGLENGVVGMKKGGKRQIAAMPFLAYDDPAFANDVVSPGEKVFFDVDLLDVKGVTDNIDKLISIQEKTPGIKDKIALCGNEAVVSYKVIGSGDAESKNPEEKTGELKFKIGDGTVPIGIEKSIFGMKLNSVRKVRIPNEFMKISKKQNLPANISTDLPYINLELELKSLQ